MKTKQILIILSITMALFIISSQTVATSQTIQAKGIPPGLAKTPGAVATQKAEDRATKEAGNPHGKHENYKGTITAADASSINLELKDGTSITIFLTAETRIFIPTVKDASPEGLVEGMTAIIQAVRVQNDTLTELTALKVVLVPGKPVKTHRVGIVTEYVEGYSITIEAKDGELYIFLLTEETKILPIERLDLLTDGARVTIISPRDVSTLDRTATGIVVHPVEVDE